MTHTSPGDLGENAVSLTARDARSPRAVIVGSQPGIVIPAARALARHHVRCIVAVPPNEGWRLRSRAIAGVVHLNGSHADAASLLRMITETEHAELVVPTTGPARSLVASAGLRATAPDVLCANPELRLIVQRFARCELSGGSGDRDGVVPWSWRDPIPTLQQTAHRALAALLPDGVGRTVRTVLELPPGHRWRYVAWRMRAALSVRRRAELPATVRSILFVCHGNRMRSPAAEWMMRAALERTLLGDTIAVASAGTHARAGVPVDERVGRAALDLGVALGSHLSRPLAPELVREADAIIAMDGLIVAHLLAAYPDAAAKTYLLGHLAPIDGYTSPDIPDPYFGSDDDVIATVRRIHAAVRELTARLVAGLARRESRTP